MEEVFPNSLPRIIMQPMPKLDPEAYVAQMRVDMEAMLAKVADAINNAPDGHIIAASERPVFDLFAAMRQKAYEAGIQMRTDAAEAAFSPSAGSHDGNEAPQ
jgi:hypothetical protein